MVNTIIIITGWITAQAAPRIVCLYRTFTSRKVRKYNSSRYRHSSTRLIRCQPRCAVMTTGAISGGFGEESPGRAGSASFFSIVSATACIVVTIFELDSSAALEQLWSLEIRLSFLVWHGE